MIKAKAVSEDFWILKDGTIKVGEINKIENSGTMLSFKGRYTMFDNIDSIKAKTNIVFDNTINESKTQEQKDVHGFPFTGEVYNSVWDLKSNLPLYTKSEESKSMFAAGWYMVKIRNKWRSILCPKLIILQRNDYTGPYKQNPHHDSY
jgi:hypothetical protein